MCTSWQCLPVTRSSARSEHFHQNSGPAARNSALRARTNPSATTRARGPAVLRSRLGVRPAPPPTHRRRCPLSGGPPGGRARLLTGTGTGVRCTCGPGAPAGWREGSRCRSPESWSCSRCACRTRWSCVPLETEPREAERLRPHAPRKGVRSRFPRSDPAPVLTSQSCS